MGEDLLICDLAQYYHILNYKEQSPDLIATLTIGLPDESRVKKALSGSILSFEQIMLVKIFDVLNLLLWTKTKDASHGRNRPESLLEKLINNDKKANDELVGFETPEEFEAYMKSFER